MENKEFSKTLNKNVPNFDPEDIDLDNLSFRPITQGLGFHPEKKEIPIIKSKQQSNFQSNPLPRATPQIRAVPKIAPRPAIQKPKIEVEVSEKAEIPTRFWAFMVDLIIICLGTVVTQFVLGSASGLSWDVLISIFTIKELIFFTIGIFSIYFLFYFSVLDLSSTVGKSMMSLEIKASDGKRPSVQNTVSRAFVTLLFLPLFGIPMLAGVEEKLSGIKVFKRKCST